MERFELRLAPEEKRRLEQRAQRDGVNVAALVRRELHHLLRGHAGSVHDAVSLALLRHEAAALRDAIADLERQHAKYLARSLEATVPALRLIFTQEAEEYALRLEAARVRLAKTLQGVETIQARQHPASPAPPAALAVFPIGLAAVPSLPVAIVAGLGAAVVIGFFVMKHRHRLRALVGKGVDIDPDVIPVGIDAGAPRGGRNQGPRGMNAREVLDRFWTHPKILTQRIQLFADQEDGLERLRVALEDENFEVLAPNRKGELDNIEVKLLVFTVDQYKRIDPSLLTDVMSRRSRPLIQSALKAAPAQDLGEPEAEKPKKPRKDEKLLTLDVASGSRNGGV